MPATEEWTDVEYLREAVRACMRAEPAQRRSNATDMHTKERRGHQRLKRPNATITVVDAKGPREVRKPDHGQWATTTHATASRPTSYSQAVISAEAFRQAKYVRCIWTLAPLYIQSILARYSPSKTQRETAGLMVSRYLATKRRTVKSQARTRIIALAILAELASPAMLMTVFGMTPKEWDNSRHRRLAAELEGELDDLDHLSLLAWEEACYKREWR